MKQKKIMYILIFLPLVLTMVSMIVLPNEVAIRYSNSGIQYGSKWSLIILPLFSLWIGGFMLLIGKASENTEQEAVVRKITYVPLGIFNIVTILALLGAAFIREGKTSVHLLDVIAGCFLGIIAIMFAIYASFTAREKGPIISNPYLWLSKEERDKIDKKVEYRQLTVVFSSLALSFAMLAIYIVTDYTWTFVIMWVSIAFVIIYAVVSSIKEVIKK